MWDDTLNMTSHGLTVTVSRAQSMPVDGFQCGSTRVVVGFDCSSPSTPSQPSTPRQRVPRSPLCNLLSQYDPSMKRSLSINVGGSRLSPALAGVLGTHRKALSLADLRGSPSDAGPAFNGSLGSSLSHPSTPIPIPDSREYQLRPEAALLEDLSVEEEPAHLHPPSVDLPMRQPICGSGGRYPEEAASEVPFVVMHPENAVKQLRCLEERLRQMHDEGGACQLVAELRVREEERARLHRECTDLRARSMALDECTEMLFEFEDAPPRPRPPAPPPCPAPGESPAWESHLALPATWAEASALRIPPRPGEPETEKDAVLHGASVAGIEPAYSACSEAAVITEAAVIS